MITGRSIQETSAKVTKRVVGGESSTAFAVLLPRQRQKSHTSKGNFRA
jgi:hypothetical protein